jgi:biotin carboxyl carrier protein
MEKSIIIRRIIIMKNYTITVNGNVYDVTVEEGTGSAAPAAAPKAAPAAPKAAPAAPKAAAPAGAAGSVTVAAPMPGKILGVKANPGQAVKKGDVIVILEAMKMENEIVAPQDGTIASINVATGDSVEAGATLATLN